MTYYTYTINYHFANGEHFTRCRYWKKYPEDCVEEILQFSYDWPEAVIDSFKIEEQEFGVVNNY